MCLQTKAKLRQTNLIEALKNKNKYTESAIERNILVSQPESIRSLELVCLPPTIKVVLLGVDTRILMICFPWAEIWGIGNFNVDIFFMSCFTIWIKAGPMCRSGCWRVDVNPQGSSSNYPCGCPNTRRTKQKLFFGNYYPAIVIYRY